MELMLAVGMLTIVILALYAMFDQTQKALKQSLNQAEISEGGRSALDLMVRSLERAASPQVEDALHLVIKPAKASGYDLIFPGGNSEELRTQPLRFDEIFFTYRLPGDRWHVAGIFVGNRDGGPVTSSSTADNYTGLGAVYLFDEALPNTNLVQRLSSLSLLGSRIDDATVPAMRLSGPPEMQTNLITSRLSVPAFVEGENRISRNDGLRLLEGVLQFRITAFDADGRPYNGEHPIINDLYAPRIGVNTNSPLHVPLTPQAWAQTNRNLYNGVRPLPVEIVEVNDITSQVVASFRGTNLPAAIELELTLLDGKQLEQFRSLPELPEQARKNWLKNNSGAVQTLRQRVVLRSAPQ